MIEIVYSEIFNNEKVELTFIYNFDDEAGHIKDIDENILKNKIKQIFLSNDIQNIKDDNLTYHLNLTNYLIDALPEVFAISYTSDNCKKTYFKEHLYEE